MKQKRKNVLDLMDEVRELEQRGRFLYAGGLTLADLGEEGEA